MTDLVRLEVPDTDLGYCQDVQFDSTGTWLAVIVSADGPPPYVNTANSPPGELRIYRRTGRALTRMPGLATPTVTAPATVRWTPDGTHLILITRTGVSSGGVDRQSRITLWANQGGTLRLVDNGTNLNSEAQAVRTDVQYRYPKGGLDLTAGGRHLLLGTINSAGGVVVVDGDRLDTTRLLPLSGVYGATYDVAWHPGGTFAAVALAPANGQSGVLTLIDRTGDDLTIVGDYRYRGSISPQTVRWHPSGTLLLAETDRLDGQGGDGGVVPGVYRYDPGGGYFDALSPAGYLGPLYGVPTACTFDPSGRWVAGGPAWTGGDDTRLVTLPDYRGLNEGSRYARGDWAGLTVTALDDLTGTAFSSQPYPGTGETVRPAAADTCAGRFTSWAVNGTTSLILAAGGGYRTPDGGDTFTPDLLPGGFALYELTAAPAVAASLLYMRGPDGAYLNVGTAARPVSMRLPDGTMRTWPGSNAPLYMRMPDGTWRKLI